MDERATQKSLASKLSEVGAAIGFGVQKDGKNNAQNYSFVSAGNVRMEVGPELAKRKIAVSSKIEVLSESEPVSAAGKPQHRVMLRSTLTFVDGDTGETLSAQGIGCGMDNQDKAPMKAQTAAEKYAYVSAFTLAMGEDPEHDEPEKPKRDDRLGDEEHARAEKQGAVAAELAAGFVNDFTTLTHVDDAMRWLDANMEPVDALGEKLRKLVASECSRHVATGTVEGMSTIGFKEAWTAARDASRNKANGGKRR